MSYHNITRVRTHDSIVSHTSRTSRASRNSQPELHLHIERRNTLGSVVCSSPHPLDGVEETVSLNLEDDRREPKVHEDVWFPLIHADESGGKLDGNIDFDALNNYIDVDYDSDEDVRSPDVDAHDPEKTMVQRKYSYIGDFGKSPNDEVSDRFTFYSTIAGTIRARSLHDIAFEGQPLAELLKTGTYWVDVMAPTDVEMRMISKVFRIHPLTMEDINTQEMREKCEIFPNYMFVSFRSFHQDHQSSEYMRPLSFYSVVLKNGILTFHFKPTPHPSKVRARVQQLKDFIAVTPDWISYALVDDIVDAFAPLIHQIEIEVDSIDELVLLLRQQDQHDMMRRIGHCRKQVMLLLRLLTHKADVVKGLMKRCEERAVEPQTEAAVLDVGKHKKVMHQNVALYFGDIQDHIVTMVQNLNHYEKMLARSHSNYLAQISIELTQTSGVTNDVVGRLTVFASVIVPMGLVAGLWGMNVKVPGRDENDLVWFFWILGGLAMFASFGIALSRRAGLL